LSGAAATDPAPLRAARALRRGVAGLAALMAWVAGWNYVACALFITADVLGRNLLGVSSAATVEVTGYMLAVGIA
jgi:TRAP-type mannitol/chloroaromatic compound transport system permease small subunit